MPSLRGKQFDFDTTNWTAHDWRRARIWNAVFFVGWFAFFACAMGSLLYDGNWLMFVPFFVIGVGGCISQLVWLVRVSAWLKGDKSP
jgi:hypothetical protein